MNSTKNKKTIFVINFGCKTNYADGNIITHQAIKSKFVEAATPEQANIVILNSCTVTANGDRDLRKTARRIKRLNQNAKIIITGCAVEVYKDELEQTLIKPKIASLIVPKSELINILNHKNPFVFFNDDTHPFSSQSSVINFRGEVATEAINETESLVLRQVATTKLFPDTISATELKKESHRTRYFLKIQDGCNNVCTYCVVRLARKKSRSLEIEKVLELIKTISDAGFKEIVLTGIHLGFYGHDLLPQESLLSLLKKIAQLNLNIKIRLSSLEPSEISTDLITFISNNDFIARHLHIPLQSGDNRVLKRMARRYTREHFIEKIKEITNILGNIALGTDLITGFPGETEEMFQNSLELIKTLPFTYVHTFSFSPRPKTAAYNFKDQIPHHLIKERTKKIIEAAKQKKLQFLNTHKGKIKKVLMETWQDGVLSGHTEHYVQIKAQGFPDLINTYCNVKITKIVYPFAIGELIG